MKFRIPVSLHGDRIVPTVPLPLPNLRGEAIGHITFASEDLSDKRQERLYRHKWQITVPTCDGILVGLRNSVDLVGEFKERLMPAGWPKIRFVQVAPLEPLLIECSAARLGSLLPCRMYIPSIEREASSLNQAYTLLSERFEPDRISHTGNAFDTCYYFGGESWLPLRYLRDRGTL